MGLTDTLDLFPAHAGVIPLTLADYIIKNGDGDGIAWEDVRDQAADIAETILENSYEVVNSDELQIQRDVRDYLRTTKITFNDKSDIADYEQFRKRNFGRILLSNEGIGVDSLRICDKLCILL